MNDEMGDGMSDSHETTADRIAELLLAWEESIAAGKPLSASALCHDSPELEPELDREIRLLQNVNHFMFASDTPVAFFDRETIDASQVAGLPSCFPTVPGYDILEQIGRGGMGVVYLARQKSLERFVAIKTLAGSRWAQPEFVARLRREARALSQLNHPHVVHVFDVVDTDASVSVVLEFVDGENLAQRLNGMPISSREAAQFALTLARTLASVHSQGILHRDIKPANVLLSRSGEMKIADFGLAKELGTENGQSITGELYGSPCYMAPEQANGRREDISARTDVYAIGATLYEMLTGRPPFAGASTIDTVNQVLKREPVALRVLNPGIPRDLETICLKCLEKKADRRFGSAMELADELQRFLAGIPIYSRPIGVIDRGFRWCQRHPGISGLVALTAMATMVIAALVVSSNASHRRELTKYNEELKRLNNDLIAETAKARFSQRLAEENSQRAKESEERTKEGLYASDIGRAATALKHEDTRTLTEILDRHIPGPGQLDRRGFEWWYLYRQTHLNSRLLLETGAPQYFMCDSPDQMLMAAAGKDAVVRVFEPETGKVLKQIVTGQVEVNGIAFSPDGIELATSGDDGSIRIWNLESGIERLKIVTGFRKAFDILYLADGSGIVSCGISPHISIFNTDDGQQRYVLSGHLDTVESLVLSDEGKTLISVSNDHSLRIWNLEERTERAKMSSPDFVAPMVYDPVRRILITGNSVGLVRTIDVARMAEISNAKHLDRLGSLALHPDGSLLAVGDAGGRIRLQRIGPAGEFLEDNFQPWQAHVGNVYFLDWSRDGSRLISSGKDGKIQSWSVEEAKRSLRNCVTTEPSKGSGPFSQKPAKTLVPRFGDSVARWNTQVRLPSRRDHANYLQFAVSHDVKYLATLNDQSNLELFAISKDREVPIDSDRLAEWKSSEITRIVGFLADTTSLVVVEPKTLENGKRIEQMSILSVPTLERQEQIPIEGFKNPVLSHDTRQLVFSSAAHLMIWDIVNRKVSLKIPIASVRENVFNSDGTLVAVALANRSIMIWNTTDGTLQVQLNNHRSLIREILFSPDSRTLVTATEDRSLKFTSVVTGQELLELPNVGKIDRLEFSQDGQRLFCQTRSNSESEASDDVLVFDATKELVRDEYARK